MTHNRDPKSKEEKIDGRSQPAMSPSNGLRFTMGDGIPDQSSVVHHNRDLKSKEEKIDRRLRLRITMGEGGTLTRVSFRGS